MKFIRKIKKVFFRLKQDQNHNLYNNLISVDKRDIEKVKLNIIGSNNIIDIGKLSENMQSIINISIYGDNCSIKIDRGFFTSYGISILLGSNHPYYEKIKNTHLKIGENTSIEGAKIITLNSNNTISIGKDCMLSENILIYNTDAHPIYDINSKSIINYVGDLNIGDHCWIGMDVKIMKNVFVEEGCIIGAGSLVTKKFLEKNCIIAGVPAYIVKRNIYWKRSDKNWIEGRYKNVI